MTLTASFVLLELSVFCLSMGVAATLNNGLLAAAFWIGVLVEQLILRPARTDR